MRTAICDDDESQLKEISAYILADSEEHSVETYTSAVTLIGEYGKGKRYDLIFLDIQMDDLNGFEAAKILRTKFPDEKPRIAFLTVTEEYSKLGYGIGIWDYISKPAEKERIFEALDRARAEIKAQTCFIPTTDGNLKFRFKRIFYARSDRGKTIVCTAAPKNASNKQQPLRFFVRARKAECDATERREALPKTKHETKLTLTELEECFPKIMFCRIHRFYLVNLTHVVKHERNRVFLPNGEVFPIGRAYERAFRDGLERFLRSGSDG